MHMTTYTKHLGMLLFHSPPLLIRSNKVIKYIGTEKLSCFAKNFSKNSNLDDSGISLSVFTSGTNLKLHSISVKKMVKKFIKNLDLSKASGSDCVSPVLLKKCEH